MVGGGGKNWGKLCLWILKDTIPQKLYIFLKGKQKSCLFKKNTYISLNDHEGQQHITKQSGKKNTGARIHLKLFLKRPRIHKSTRKQTNLHQPVSELRAFGSQRGHREHQQKRSQVSVLLPFSSKLSRVHNLILSLPRLFSRIQNYQPK